ncbi:hypothetical protein CPB83DRAFT_911007 [Crepidotus variabilis]|uniref:Uncharacterized protein n=1 Tax=Crepidotus variabilis TaxID=179855 RepID=A0A9P6E5U5_9AGAR|nr:hypothetical protein CPB83DRAFT_911007 [Crepidotus variabilis]
MEEYTHGLSEESLGDDSTMHPNHSTTAQDGEHNTRSPSFAPKDGSARKKIVYLCVHGSKNYLHYAVVPLPSSYQDAKKTAIDVLGGYLGYPNIIPDDIYLRYGIKRGSGLHWAYIKPDFWDQVITGGEELRIVRKVKSGQDEVEIESEQQKSLFVTFRLGKNAQASPRDKYARMLLAENDFETKKSLVKLFCQSLTPMTRAANLILFAVIKNQDGRWVASVIDTSEGLWKKTILECKKENPHFEILVVESPE